MNTLEELISLKYFALYLRIILEDPFKFYFRLTTVLNYSIACNDFNIRTNTILTYECYYLSTSLNEIYLFKIVSLDFLWKYSISAYNLQHVNSTCFLFLFFIDSQFKA